MSYIRADDILPEEIISLVQQYIDGQSIYIPRKAGCHKAWGAGTGTRYDLMIRNRQICEAYQSGMTVMELSEKFFLTEKSVRRIIRAYRASPPDKMAAVNHAVFQEELYIE